MSPHGPPDPETYLEPDQLRADRTKPLPRAPIGRSGQRALWAMRIVAFVLSAMVIVTFVHSLG